MAVKITDLPPIANGNVSSGLLLEVVDPADTTDSPGGTSKSITQEQLASLLPAPSTTTRGGVKRNTGSAGQFVTGIASDGSLQFDTPSGGGGGGGGSIARVIANKGGTDQTGLGNGSFVTITWPVEVEDTGGDLASDALTVASGEEWTIHVIFKTQQATNANIVELAIFKDGSHYLTLSGGASYGSGASYGGSCFLSEAGSYTVRAHSPSGQSLSALGTATSTWFQAIRTK